MLDPYSLVTGALIGFLLAWWIYSGKEIARGKISKTEK